MAGSSSTTSTNLRAVDTGLLVRLPRGKLDVDRRPHAGRALDAEPSLVLPFDDPAHDREAEPGAAAIALRSAVAAPRIFDLLLVHAATRIAHPDEDRAGGV